MSTDGALTLLACPLFIKSAKVKKMALKLDDAMELARHNTTGVILLKLSFFRHRYSRPGLQGKWMAPKLSDLARQLFLNTKTVRTHLEKLEEKGLIKTATQRFQGSPRLYIQLSDQHFKISDGKTVLREEMDLQPRKTGSADGQNWSVYKEQKKEQNKSETARECAASPETGQAPEKVACGPENEFSGKAEGNEQPIRPVRSLPPLGHPPMGLMFSTTPVANELAKRRGWTGDKKSKFSEWYRFYLHKCGYRKMHGVWPYNPNTRSKNQ